MDFTKELLNFVLTLKGLVIFLIVTPPFLVINFISFIKRCINPENVSGKVVLITGASSGIGENVAYEYAKRGARLVLAARREERLRNVADEARKLGSPDVLVVPTDVSNTKHCQRLIDETISHFGQLDHLVNNAGIIDACMFEDSNVSDFVPFMDINFWGSVYTTRAAIHYLKKSKGKIIVIASSGVWFSLAKMSFYNASKAAMIEFFEALRIELGSDIGITIVTPGIVQSEMTDGDFLSRANMKLFPVSSSKATAKAIVRSACRGDKYLTEPAWVGFGFMYQLLFPEFLECFNRFLNTKCSFLMKR